METLGTAGTKIDLNHLDNVTTLFQNKGALPELDQLLNAFVEREDLFLYSEEVLMSDCKSSSKFFFLKGLTKLISTRWPVIPDDSKEKNREVLINFISQPYDSNIQAVLTKAFAALTEILKFDLDQNWPNFFDVFFSFASNSPINGLQFLSYFSQEIVTDSEQVVTSNRASELMTICTNQLDNILEFSYTILQGNLDNSILIKSALPVFSVLVSFLSINKILQSPILGLIIEKFITTQDYALESCEVLIHILESLHTTNVFPEYISNVSQMFLMVIETLHNLCQGDYLSFPYRIQNMFLMMMDKCLTNFIDIFNQSSIIGPLQIAYTWVMQLTMEPTIDQSLQEMCFCVWINSYSKLLLSKVFPETQEVFSHFMGPLRRAIIANFPQPYKIVTYIDDFNNETRIFQNQQFTSHLYSTVRDCFLFLTNSDAEDTINAINERFEQGNELTIEDIQKLGYSISATAGAFKESIENTAVFEIIQRYFTLCQSSNPSIESTEGGRMKVACSLIYMCSQYFSILNRFNALLKAVLQLIMKFLIEGDFELQAVSINALKTLSQRCKMMVAFPQGNDNESFLSLLLENSTQIFNSMEPDNIVELFRVFAIIIRVHNEEQTRLNFLQQLMAGINKMWEDTVMNSSFNPLNIQQCHVIELTLMCHSSILLSLSNTYATILKDFLPQLMTVMQILTQAMPQAESEEILNAIKSAKSQILFILFRFSYFSYNQDLILEMVIPGSFQPILDDYINSEPQFRIRPSLKYFTAVFNRCSSYIDDMAFNAFDLIMQETLPTISANYSDFIEIRTEFFNLAACIAHQYSRPLALKEADYIDNFMKTLKFGAEHPDQHICENCVELISDIFRSFKTEMLPSERYADFFNHYVIDVVQLYFQLLTDFTYKFAFQQLTMSIKNVFIIENMKEKASDVFDFLCSMFQSVSPKIIMELVQSLLIDQPSSEFANSRVKLRDFVLLIKVVMPNDPDIYKEEIIEMKNALNKPFREMTAEAEHTNDEEADEINQQIIKDFRVAPSSQMINELASISLRNQS